jgi:hypothetical protein
VVGLAKTLIQAAYHHVGSSEEQVSQLKRIASKLPRIPFELTAKNKAFLREFESDRLRAELLFLPERLVAEVAKALAGSKLDFVRAQVAVAIDFQLAIPLRPQNLSRLNWQRHLSEPDGPRGRLLLHIPKDEMKGGREDFTAEVPDDVARRLRWYRRHILTRLNADVNGDLFVTRKGSSLVAAIMRVFGPPTKGVPSPLAASMTSLIRVPLGNLAKPWVCTISGVRRIPFSPSMLPVRSDSFRACCSMSRSILASDITISPNL